MNVGDKAILNCPSNTAYGDRGNSVIPGGATLQFDIKIISAETQEAEEEEFNTYDRRAAIREALRSDESKARQQEIARLRAKTRKFALTSIEEELAEKPVEEPKESAIEKLDVAKIELPDVFALAKKDKVQPAAEPVSTQTQEEATTDENSSSENLDDELYGDDFKQAVQSTEQIAAK